MNPDRYAGLTQRQESLAKMLYDIGAFEDKSKSPDGRGFRLKHHEDHPDAPLSPFRFNLRTPNNPSKGGPLSPEVVNLIGLELYDLAKREDLQYDTVTGIPWAGEPLAQSFVSAASVDGRTVPLIRLRKIEEGDRRLVAGVISAGPYEGRVLIIDDLITKSHSKLEAIGVLEEAGYTVSDVIVLIDREQGGAGELRQAEYRLHAVYGVMQLLDLYRASKLLGDLMYEEISTYLFNELLRRRGGS